VQAIYYTTTEELTVSFLENIKKQFKNHSIEIIIKEQDETQYLNSSEVNKKYLEEAIREVEKGNIIQKTPQELGL
jgi:GTP cyclohydrolase FolE2